MSVLNRDQARALIERVLKLSLADAIQINIDASEQSNIRFADNRITTAGSTDDIDVRIYSAFGRRSAIASTNDVSNPGLEQAVRQSERLARLAPENPEALPLLAAQQYQQIDSHFESAANASPGTRARAIGDVLAMARAADGLSAAGILTVANGIEAVGNSNGLFAFHPATSVDFTTTVRTRDGTGSGWAGANRRDWDAIDFKAVSARAMEKARASRSPTAIEPGRYTVILEPQAAGDLVSLIANAFDARSAAEGRGAFSKPGGGTKLGEKIMDDRITLVSDPEHPAIRSAPFDNNGLPLQRRTWIEQGVLKNLVYSRFWAQKQGSAPTGSPAALMLVGGTQSLAEIIGSTERGILVTRFWYIRAVNPRTLLFTGLTRDGTFLVENGRVTRPLRNMRFNESPLFMLDKLDAVGQFERLSGDSAGTAMPPLRVRDFHFTSVSDAI